MIETIQNNKDYLFTYSGGTGFQVKKTLSRNVKTGSVTRGEGETVTINADGYPFTNEVRACVMNMDTDEQTSQCRQLLNTSYYVGPEFYIPTVGPNNKLKQCNVNPFLGRFNCENMNDPLQKQMACIILDKYSENGEPYVEFDAQYTPNVVTRPDTRMASKLRQDCMSQKITLKSKLN